jgi:esterase/lipase superfamily enzyme
VDETEVLLASLARAWEDFGSADGGGRIGEAEGLESDLLVALRWLEDAADTEGVGESARAARAAVWAAAGRSARLEERLQLEYDALLLSLDRELETTPPALAGAVKHQRCLEVPVLYATDRRPETVDGVLAGFAGDRGELAYGIVRVCVPDDHRLGALEKPRKWRLQFRARPERDVAVGSLSPLTADEFVKAAAGLAAGATGGDTLVFIHGYRVSFEDAARRAAQLAYDLQFPGLPMLYSWPSEARASRYAVDEDNARWSLPHFREFLRLLRDEVGGLVHVIAHSMGNRMLAEALGAGPSLGQVAQDAEGAVGAGGLGHVVFAAPDVDASVFTDLARSFAWGSGRFTLYASSKDQALRLSRRLKKYPRAGQSGKGIVVVAGVDTIDATALDTGLMSHSYYGDNTSIVADIYAIIRQGHPPDQRFGLRSVRHPDGQYWAFTPQRG